MSKKLLLFPLFLAFFCWNLEAQTVEELKAQKAEKQAQVDALVGEIGGIQGKIDAMPGWRFSAVGTLGLNFSQFNDWLSTETPNTFSSTIGFSGGASANLIQEKYFWRNAGSLTLAKTKLDLDTTTDSIGSGSYETTADAFNISSLFGYRLNEKLAASTLAEYRTTFLSNFNDPGYLDIGVGLTWTPINDLVVVFHPLNYNIVFSSTDLTYESSLGCKIVADYAKSLPRGINWSTNLSAFVSYSDPNNLSNWTWINKFGATIWKGLGVGLDIGLRGNKQESFNAVLPSQPELKIADLSSDDNKLQTYWLLGFTYNL